MFEFLYIVILTITFFVFGFGGIAVYSSLEILRFLLVIFRKKQIFCSGFNFLMSSIFLVYMDILFVIIWGASRFGHKKNTLGDWLIGILFFLTPFILNIMSVLKVYTGIKKIEYNKKMMLRHFVFALVCAIVSFLIPFPIIYYWYY